MKSKTKNTIALAVFVVISELAGVVGSLFTVRAIPAWYAGLTKPALNPPAWVFGPVWTLLYALMGVAAFLIWVQAESRERTRALRIFALQLILNAAWSIIFFGLENPGLAFADIIFLWLAIVWTTAAFYKISRTAAYLLLPYIVWVSFAVYLNYSIWRLNV